LLCNSSGFSQNVGSGMTFLKLCTTARAIAMGETYSVSHFENGALTYNVGSLAFASKNEISLSHKNWIAETSTEYFGATILGKDLAYAFTLNSTNIGGIEVRTQPGPVEQLFDAHNFSTSASIALKVMENVSLGITGKFLYEKIFVDEATGYGIDVGTVFKLDDNISFGAAINNIGVMNELRTEKSSLPALVRLGGGYSIKLTEQFDANAAFDFIKTFSDNISHIHTGVELNYDSLFSIRAGYLTGYDAKNISAGFGVHYSFVQFDYAFVPHSEILGSGHTFTIGFTL
jgi:hypothetical protein